MFRFDFIRVFKPMKILGNSLLSFPEKHIFIFQYQFIYLVKIFLVNIRNNRSTSICNNRNNDIHHYQEYKELGDNK